VGRDGGLGRDVINYQFVESHQWKVTRKK
jgi:hypothetical protein